MRFAVDSFNGMSLKDQLGCLLPLCAILLFYFVVAAAFVYGVYWLGTQAR